MSFTIYRQKNKLHILNDATGIMKTEDVAQVRVVRDTAVSDTFTFFSDDLGLIELDYTEARTLSGLSFSSANAFEYWADSNTGDSSNEIDYFINHAANIILETYGDVISVERKAKDLVKFGRHKQVQTTRTTLMTLPTNIYNETYIETNGITHVSSSSTSDTSTISLEYHTVDGSGNKIFGAQEVILNGQNKVPLSVPCARASRARATGTTDLIGDIYFYEDTAIVAGVPTDGTKVHLMIEAGLNNSEKASTTIQNNNYWLVTNFYGDCLEKTPAFGVIHFEIREKDGVFLNFIDRAANTNYPCEKQLHPFSIAPPNSDIRLRATADANNKDFSGGMLGLLAVVIT